MGRGRQKGPSREGKGLKIRKVAGKSFSSLAHQRAAACCCRHVGRETPAENKSLFRMVCILLTWEAFVPSAECTGEERERMRITRMIQSSIAHKVLVYHSGPNSGPIPESLIRTVRTISKPRI